MFHFISAYNWKIDKRLARQMVSTLHLNEYSVHEIIDIIIYDEID